VGPWYPVIPVEMVPSEAGGDNLMAIRAAGVGHDRMERLDRIEAAVMRALNYIDEVMRASDALRPAQRDIPGTH